VPLPVTSSSIKTSYTPIITPSCSRPTLHSPPHPIPFPYTTLFRSATRSRSPAPPSPSWAGTCWETSRGHARTPPAARSTPHAPRSEEHTSELQSPDHLVCRLLLEKKQNK